MNISSKIRAFFTFKGEFQEIELSAAEIKKDKAFLHSSDDPNHVFSIKTKAVDIFINPEAEVLEENIDVIETSKNKPNDNSKKAPKDENNGQENYQSDFMSYYIPKKKRISILLYPEEYDMIMNHIQSHGYKKTEYFLACTKAARQTSVESAYKYYTKFHKQKKAEDMQKAREAQQSAIKQ